MNREENSLKSLENRILAFVLYADIALAIISVLVMEEPLRFILGLVFGSTISALNFKELSVTLRRAVEMQPARAQTFATKKYFFRYIVTAVVIYIAIVAPYINVIGTIVGLILIKFIILATNLFNDKHYYKNILKRKEDEPSGR